LFLRVERKRRGLTLAEVSRRTGIHPTALSRLERGELRAYPGWRRRLARSFRLPADTLFREVPADDGNPVTD